MKPHHPVHLGGKAFVVGRDQCRAAFVFHQLQEFSENALRGCLVQVSGRLVRKNQRRSVRERTSNRNPLLLALTWGLLGAISLAATQVRVVDTAREVARAAARGDRAPDVDSGDAAVRVSVSRQGARVRVVATSDVSGPGGLFRFLPAVELSSTAVAVEEPS